MTTYALLEKLLRTMFWPKKMCAYLSQMIYLGLNNSFLSDFVGYHCYHDEIILVESNYCQIHLRPHCLSWWWYELPILNIGIIPRWGTHDSVMVPHLPKLVPIKGRLNYQDARSAGDLDQYIWTSIKFISTNKIHLTNVGRCWFINVKGLVQVVPA